MIKLLVSTVFLCFLTNGPLAQQPITLRQVLRERSIQIFQGCGGWPPKLIPNNKPKDRQKELKDITDDEGDDLLTAMALRLNGLNPNETPKVYRASYLRLMDSLGDVENTDLSSLTDPQLLNLALKTSPENIQRWGNDQYVIKYDCMSMLGLLADAKVGFSLPFFSLDSAFNASRNTQAKTAAIFFYGKLQAPFIKAYSSPDDAERRLAATRAITWRLNSLNYTTPDTYVLAADILSIQVNTDDNNATSLLGKIKGGVSIPIISANGSASGELDKALKATGTSYITYYWNLQKNNLPTIDQLSTQLNSDMPADFKFDKQEILPEFIISASSSVKGWAEELCTSGSWDLKTNNPNFRATSVELKPPTNQTSPIPSCNITARFVLKNEAKDKSSLGDPELTLTNLKNTNVVIQLKTPAQLYSIVKPAARLDHVAAEWKKFPENGVNYVEWDVSGTVSQSASAPGVPPRIVTKVNLLPDGLVCVDTKGKPYTLDNIEQISQQTSSTFNGRILLAIDTVSPFDDNIDQPNKTSCFIKGKMMVATETYDKKDHIDDTIDFKVDKPVYYPSQKSKPETPAKFAATLGVGQVTLSWATSYSATSYNLFRSTTPGSQGEPLKDKIAATSYVDTAGLANGTTYYYRIQAINGLGESDRSAEVSAIPKQPN